MEVYLAMCDSGCWEIILAIEGGGGTRGARTSLLLAEALHTLCCGHICN